MREAHFEVKMYKTLQRRTTFGSCVSEKCTPLWREARFQVKMYKTHQCRTALEVEMSKKCTPLWREAHFEVKMYKTPQCRTAFGSCDVEKVHAVVARSTFRSQNVKNTRGSDHFWMLRCRSAWQVQGPLSKVSKTWGFVAFRKTMAGMGLLKRICKDAFSVAGAVQKTCSWEMLGPVRRSGRSFPERGCILEHQICRFAKMILRDRRSTSYDLASIFRGRRSTLERWSRKIAKRIGTRLSALHYSTFWCCQIQKLNKSRRIVSFWKLSSSKNEEVSRNCFVLDVVTFKN